MTLSALVVADDLTGAMDTGHAFAARGHPTTVAVRADAVQPDGGVCVVNTDSRYRPADEARSAVERAVSGVPTRLIYKKVDSTLRGNLTAEIDAALDASGADRALVAPALPAHGRLTACGFHLVEGALVTDTAAGQDPDKPVASAHLPTLLADATRPVCHVGVETVARGADAVAEVIRETDGEILACDVVHDDHLTALARGATRSERNVVFVGSAGLAGAVEIPDEPDGGTAPDAHPPTDARVLGIAGSASPVTLEQLAAVPDDRTVRLDVERATADPVAAADEAATRALERLDGHGTAVVTSALEGGDVGRALRAGREAGVAPDVVRDRIAEGLAWVGATVWERDPPDGLFVTGGTIANRTLEALDASGIRLTGEAVESGVPIGRVLDGSAGGTRVVTKAGAFGSERTIANCLARLGGTDAG